MTRNARLIGLEGRTIVNISVAEGTREVRMPSFDGTIKVDDDNPDSITTFFNEVVYHFDFEADDGTLIYRRVTPLWRDK